MLKSLHLQFEEMLLTSTKQVVSTQQQQQDVIRTFVLLQLEKRRLLDIAADQLRRRKQAKRNGQETSPMQEMREQQQLHQQMNDFNRRQHAVVQRMSAKERYKRKKTTTTTTTRPHKAAATTTTPRALPPSSSSITTDEQQTANGSSKSRESSAERLICNAEALFSHSAETCDQIVQYFEKRKQLVVETPATEEHSLHHQSSQPNDISIAQQQKEIDDGWKRLQNNLQKDAKAYKELAYTLRHGKPPSETIEQQQEMCNNNGEPSKQDVRIEEFKELFIGFFKSVDERRAKSARERR